MIDGTGCSRFRADLYIVCGISVAIQHYLGMEEAKFVVAINRAWLCQKRGRW
ncbi:MAG TPA: hypothetical protein EYH32_09945 [Anaerolineae bacterium]|nr:hypothetical protein [Anaerolineae bacterium]